MMHIRLTLLIVLSGLTGYACQGKSTESTSPTTQEKAPAKATEKSVDSAKKAYIYTKLYS